MRRIFIILLILGLAACDADMGPTMHGPDTTQTPDAPTGEDTAGAEDLVEDLPPLEDVPGPDVVAQDVPPPQDSDPVDVPLCPAGVDCDDGDPCTDDACVPGVGCQSVGNESPCDDGDGCTWGDHCRAGICRGTLTESNGCSYSQVPALGSCKKGAVTGSAKGEALAVLMDIPLVRLAARISPAQRGDDRAEALVDQALA